jgi:hypothetical protein
MSIKRRLAKLEAIIAVDSEPHQLAIFFEHPAMNPSAMFAVMSR